MLPAFFQLFLARLSLNAQEKGNSPIQKIKHYKMFGGTDTESFVAKGKLNIILS